MRRVGELPRKSAPVSGSKNFTKSRDEKVDAWDERIARAESTLCCHTLGGKRHIFEKTNNVTYILSQTSQTIFFRLQKIKSFSKIFFEKILQKCLKNLFKKNWKMLKIEKKNFWFPARVFRENADQSRRKPDETVRNHTKPLRNHHETVEKVTNACKRCHETNFARLRVYNI